MFVLNNEKSLPLYPVKKEELHSLLNDAFQYISSQIGPFEDDEVIVTLKESGGGGASPGCFSISPLIISDHNSAESLYSFILHEMTHVLTYQWGESFLPLFSEGIAYQIGGVYLNSKYGNGFHAFVKAYLETERIQIIDLLDPQKFFDRKESYGFIPKYSASFTAYLIEKYGIESIKVTFEYGGKLNYEEARYQKAKKHRIQCLKQWLSDLGKRNIQELEHEYLEYIGKTAKIEPNSVFHKRKEEDCNRRPYPFWHCYRCWRPNEELTNRCSYCKARKRERNEFDKLINADG